MKSTKLVLTQDELRLLASLASDQLFRRQFIDSRMPGFKNPPEELDLGKALVARMRLLLDDRPRPATPSSVPPATSKQQGIS